MMASKPAKLTRLTENVFMKRLRLVLGIIGIIIVIVHMTYYVIKPYSMLYFFLGFGVIYFLFFLPLNIMNKKFSQ